jgi:hypothetical protein
METAAITTDAVPNKEDDAEKGRVVVWNSLPLGVRYVALMAARIPRERANDPLSSFTSDERTQISLAADRLSSQLVVAKGCMATDPEKAKPLLH